MSNIPIYIYINSFVYSFNIIISNITHIIFEIMSYGYVPPL